MSGRVWETMLWRRLLREQEREAVNAARIVVARDLLQMAPDLARINPEAGWAAVRTAARILTASLESGA